MLHHKRVESLRKNYFDVFYVFFRAFAGLLFMQHGAQKLFGVLGGQAQLLFVNEGLRVFGINLFFLAGIIEFFGGLLIVIGLFTVPVSFFVAIEMILAYFIVHFPIAVSPAQNSGELALLYFIVFIFAMGPGKLSLDVILCNECVVKK